MASLVVVRSVQLAILKQRSGAFMLAGSCVALYKGLACKGL